LLALDRDGNGRIDNGLSWATNTARQWVLERRKYDENGDGRIDPGT
jgi:hypothetical protein